MGDAERETYLRRLQFPPELERAFQDDYYRRILAPMRLGLVIALLLCAAMGAREYVRSGNSHVFITTGLGGVLLLVALALTFTPAFGRWWQLFWVLSALSSPIIFSAGHILDPDAGAGLFTRLEPDAALRALIIMAMIVMVVQSAVLRLQFVWSLAYLSLLFGGALLVSLRYLPYPDEVILTRFPGLPLATLLALVLMAYREERAQREAFLGAHLLERERERAESVLRNVLPGSVAERLKSSREPIADDHTEATVLFADIADFTPFAAERPAREVLGFLNQVFSRFDRLVESHGVEKIKTVGDCYMAVAGAPAPRPDHLEAAARVALAMQEEADRLSRREGIPIRFRIGMHSGPLVGGVIGEKRLLYDVWGDTVNTASRLETHGVPGAIQVSAHVAERLRGRFLLRRRGELEIKGKGRMETYFLQAEAN